MYGYSYAPQEMNEWQEPQPQPQPHPPSHMHHEQSHMQMQNVVMNPEQLQYADGYEQPVAHAIAGHPHQYMSQSPVQMHPHMHSSDPHGAWNYLFAQFNQV